MILDSLLFNNLNLIVWQFFLDSWQFDRNVQKDPPQPKIWWCENLTYPKPTSQQTEHNSLFIESIRKSLKISWNVLFQSSIRHNVRVLLIQWYEGALIDDFTFGNIDKKSERPLSFAIIIRGCWANCETRMEQFWHNLGNVRNLKVKWIL